MRYTLTSATLVVTTFVMASFYWPVQRPEPFGQVVAQTDPQPGFIEVPIAAAPDKVELLRQEIEAKLQKRDLSFSMVDVPFQDALQYVSDALEVDVIINNRVFEENGVDLSTPVNLTLRTGNVSAKTALRLLLRQIQMEKTAAIVIRDGFIDITETDNSHEVQVYNCRDLLENVTVDQVQAARGGHGGGGMFQIGGAAGEGAGGGLGLGGSSGGGGIGLSTSCGTSSAGVALMHVLQQASQTDWMDIDGNGGTMTEFNGLITIGHTQEVHERINEILKKLRAANTQGAPANGAASGQRKS